MAKKPAKIVFFMLFVIVLVNGCANQSDNIQQDTSLNIQTKEETTNSEAKVEIIKEGVYSGSKYIISRNEDNKYLVFFETPLIRDDVVMLGAMFESINKVYGEGLIADPAPQFTQREGTNLIAFRGIEYRYLFLIVKNEFGEPYSFTMWRENLLI